MTSEPIEDMTTVISPGTTIKGELTFAGPVRISGRVEGIIRAEDLLEITAEGVVEGEIHGTFVDIQGTVKGTISASKSCRLNASAHIIGELRSANLAIAEGASFIGKVFVGSEAAEEQQEEPIQTLASAPISTGQLRLSENPPIQVRAPQPAAPQTELPTPVSVLQNRLEQMAVEAEQVAVANAAGEPHVRINQAGVQSALNRQPRIIKATR